MMTLVVVNSDWLMVVTVVSWFWVAVVVGSLRAVLESFMLRSEG